MTKLEFAILLRIRAAGLPAPAQEYRFHPTRKWRFDLAYPDKKIAIEAEGGVWTGGRHTRGGGYTKDAEKYNAAVVLGWRVLRYPAGLVGNVVDDLKVLMAWKPSKLCAPADSFQAFGVEPIFRRGQ